MVMFFVYVNSLSIFLLLKIWFKFTNELYWVVSSPPFLQGFPFFCCCYDENFFGVVFLPLFYLSTYFHRKTYFWLLLYVLKRQKERKHIFVEMNISMEKAEKFQEMMIQKKGRKMLRKSYEKFIWLNYWQFLTSASFYLPFVSLLYIHI